MPIQVLPIELSVKIAAGEVVERPASVVKELVENSLDAGASKIEIEAREGGIQFLRVTDNGCGIPREEIPVAFERHATSKITSVQDLSRIRTLGFRGEALAAIASVSSITLMSRMAEDDVGAFIHLRDGELIENGSRGCPVGTSVTVRGLFGSIPARRKFLKSEASESGQISIVVTQYALAFPEVRFTLIINGRLAFQSPGTGDRKDVLVKVYGAAAADSFMPLLIRRGMENDGISVAGYIGLPSITRSSRSHVSVFINRRWVSNRALFYAVEEAYGGVLPEGRHPVVVLDLRLPFDGVDPNVHPSKMEIRILNEKDVFRAVRNSVHDTLAQWSPIPQMAIRPAYGEFSSSSGASQSAFDVGGWSARVTTPSSDMNSEEKINLVEPKSGRLPFLRILGQVGNTYIIAEGPEGMYLIDQHTAHERVLFERIAKQLAGSQVEKQGLLDSASIELTPKQDLALNTRLPELEAFGFEIESFGEKTYLIRSVPALLAGKNIIESLTGIIDDLVEDVKGEDWRDHLSKTIACHAAIRAGQALSFEIMRELVEQLEATESPGICPHGRPTMIHLSASQLEKEFGRR